MSRLNHRQLDRHLTEQDEEIQYQREQEALDQQNEIIEAERRRAEDEREQERAARQQEMDDYFDELWRMEQSHPDYGSPYAEERW